MQGIQTRHNETVEPQPPTIGGIDNNNKGKELGTQSDRRDVTKYEKEDTVRETTQLTPANQITEHKDDKIKQLQDHTRELSDKTSKIAKLSDELNRIKEARGHVITESANDTSYNSFDNSELSGEEEEREGHRKFKKYEVLQQKYELLQQKCEWLQSQVEDYEEVLRTRTPIKSAEELMHRSTDGYQQFEFSFPFERLHQHMIAAFNSNNSTNRVWFNGKFNHETGEVFDVRIGRITDTDTTEVKNEGKTSDSTQLKDDTLNDITGD